MILQICVPAKANFLSADNFKLNLLYGRKLLRSFIGAAIGIFIVAAALQNDLIIRIPLDTPHQTFGCHKALSKLALLRRNRYVL